MLACVCSMDSGPLDSGDDIIDIGENNASAFPQVALMDSAIIQPEAMHQDSPDAQSAEQAQAAAQETPSAPPCAAHTGNDLSDEPMQQHGSAAEPEPGTIEHVNESDRAAFFSRLAACDNDFNTRPDHLVRLARKRI